MAAVYRILAARQHAEKLYKNQKIAKYITVTADGSCSRHSAHPDEIVTHLRSDIQAGQQRPHIIYIGFGTFAGATAFNHPMAGWDILPTFMIHALMRDASRCKVWCVDAEGDDRHKSINNLWHTLQSRIVKSKLGLESLRNPAGIFTLCENWYYDSLKYNTSLAHDCVRAIQNGSVIILGDLLASDYVGELYTMILAGLKKSTIHTALQRICCFETKPYYAPNSGIAVWNGVPFSPLDSALFHLRMELLWALWPEPGRNQPQPGWRERFLHDKQELIRFIRLRSCGWPQELNALNDGDLLYALFHKKLSCKYTPCDYECMIAQDTQGRFYLSEDHFQELDLLNIPQTLCEACCVTSEQIEILRNIGSECKQQSFA